MTGQHPAVAAWHDVRGDAVGPASVQLLRERPSTTIYRLVGVGMHGSNVIAKRCPSTIGEMERLVYEDIIRHLPVTAPRFYGFKQDNGSCWLLLEDVGAQRYSASSDQHRALAGRWLGRMHTEAARCPAVARVAHRLPDGGPGRYLKHLRAARDVIEQSLSKPALTAEDVALLTVVAAGHRSLEARWDDWVAAACAGVPSTLVHGDFRPKNAYLRDDGAGMGLFPIDWEMAGWGVPAADLTRVDLRAYWAVVRERWPDIDLETVERLALFGQIFRLLAGIGWAATNFAFESYEMLVRPIQAIRVLGGQLTEAVRDAESRSYQRFSVSRAPRPATDPEETRRVELSEVLRDAYRDLHDVHLISHERLKSRVHRVRAVVAGAARSLVLKRFEPRTADVNRLVVERWLPALGLRDSAPRLLAVVADRRGQWVWHMYEDLGDCTLRGADPEPRRVEAAVELVARLHTRAASHPLLSECRQHGGDLGIGYFAHNVRGAIRGLEALRPPRFEPGADDRPVRDRLLARLYGLLEEEPHRAQVFEQQAGPETLLHGDLWTSNLLVSVAREPLQAWLIDWDHTGVGPVSYDLSTLLYRFRPEDRPGVLDCYARAVARAGWHLPAPPTLNLLFETAECARYANRAIWPAVALLEDRADWAHGELREVLEWFDRLEPVLPT